MALPDRFIVKFRGGPIGGERREMRREDFMGGRYRVVQCPNYSALPAPDSLYRSEEYELGRTSWGYEGSLCVYEARWLDPNEFLHLELEKARKELKELRQETQDMQTLTAALKVLKEAL